MKGVDGAPWTHILHVHLFPCLFLSPFPSPFLSHGLSLFPSRDSSREKGASDHQSVLSGETPNQNTTHQDLLLSGKQILRLPSEENKMFHNLNLNNDWEHIHCCSPLPSWDRAGLRTEICSGESVLSPSAASKGMFRPPVCVYWMRKNSGLHRLLPLETELNRPPRMETFVFYYWKVSEISSKIACCQ